MSWVVNALAPAGFLTVAFYLGIRLVEDFKGKR